MSSISDLDADFPRIFGDEKILIENLADTRLLLTGGTGFFGRWLLHLFGWLNRTYKLGMRVTVVSRNAGRFLSQHPTLSECKWVEALEGDIRSIPLPDTRYQFIIHAATQTGSHIWREDPIAAGDVVVSGTKRILEWLRTRQIGAKMLFTSSGAIYGKNRTLGVPIGEDDLTVLRPLVPSNAYGIAKYYSEHLCTLYHHQYSAQVKIARCFAFVGPYLPMNEHYAIGNFLSDVLEGRAIRVSGDGTSVRSYLYGAELAKWLLKILVVGQAGRPYNVGSDQSISIAELAQVVNRVAHGRCEVHIAGTPNGKLESGYVPCIARAKEELGLFPLLSLEESILRTLVWASMHPHSPINL